MTEPSALFSSDNASGAHPEIVQAMLAANTGAALAYGDDERTRRAIEVLRRHFGNGAEVQFVFGGTGANVVALGTVLRRHESVLCAGSSHLFGDECGAPESVLGCKLVPLPTVQGKVEPATAARHLARTTSVHMARPRLLSISQATEWGTVYTREEIRTLADLAHAHDALLHIDGARIANAAASLQCSLAEVSTEAGADVVSCGGTKNGMFVGEAVVFAHAGTAEHAGHVRKLCTQLPSKLRFIAAQFQAAFEGDLWLRNASHANAMAKRLASGLSALPGVEPAVPVQTNAVFVALPEAILEALRERYVFHLWDADRSIARLMTSFATTEAEVDAFVATARGAAQPR